MPKLEPKNNTEAILFVSEDVPLVANSRDGVNKVFFAYAVGASLIGGFLLLVIAWIFS